ncbi:MAG: hypothetical protein AAF211_33680 [Myxococcota bacterium]
MRIESGRAVVGIVGLLACLAGCTEDPDGSDDAVAPDGPLFGASALIPGEVRTSFLAFGETLTDELETDLSETLEIPSAGLAIAGPELGTFFLVDGQAPVASRWEIGDDGEPRPTGEISFANISPSANSARPANFVYASPTKAYVLDTLVGEMAIWNPADLSIVGTVDIEEELEGDGFIAGVGARPVERDGEIVVPISFFTFTGIIGPTSRLLFIDPTTDSVREVVDIDCASVSHVIVADDGTLYAGSDAASITNRLGGLSNGEECFVRIDPGSYEIAERTLISERTGGVPAGGMFLSSGTLAYVRVLDESLVPEGKATIGELNSTPMWHWGRLDLAGTDDAVVFDERDPVSQSNLSFLVDGRSWAVEPGADFASGRLVDLSGEAPASGAELPGIVLNAFRIR